MFQHILVPLAGTISTEAALPHVLALAKLSGAKVSLCHVVESEAVDSAHPVDPFEWHLKKLEAEQYLASITARFRQAGIKVESHLLEGRATEQIIDYAHAHAVDLVVLSSHGRGDGSVGEVVRHVMLRAHISVLLLREGAQRLETSGEVLYRRVLVPLDGSQRAECVLPLVSSLAQYFESELHLSHVVTEPELPRRTPPSEEDQGLAQQLTERNREEAAAYLAQLQERLQAETHLQVDHNVCSSLHRLVEEQDVDVVVLCAHGYSGEARWPYGSVATNFVEYGSTPLLLVQDVAPTQERDPRELVTSEHWGR